MEKDKIKASIEKLAYSLKKNTNVTIDDETKDDLKFIVQKFTEDSKRVSCTYQDQSLHSTLNKLSKDSKIKVCKYDKGNGVAIFKIDNYYAKLDYIVNDTTKFI